MGNKMKTNIYAHRGPIKLWKINFLAAVLILFTLLGFKTYPQISDYIRNINITYADYNVEIKIDSANKPSNENAIAIPILMYHGITSTEDSVNTTRKNFVAHMEMIKRLGFQTINLDQFNNWLDGNIELPARSIIITFDDGRKDSYYPTDDVFKKLGFNATIFEVSGKPNNRDHFYLSWNELKNMQNSGRWDIQAHGQHSHDRIPVDADGNIGRFLSSRQYNEGSGLESEEEFERRVLKDYLNNINDLKFRLGIDPKYYAIPLNQYSDVAITNQTSELSFNNKVIKKLFKLAFIQQLLGPDIERPNSDVYNYRDVDRHRVVRVEPMNISADSLEKLLLKQEPKPINLNIETPLDLSDSIVMSLYGNTSVESDHLLFFNQPEYDIVRTLYGGSHWKNYKFDVDIERVSGKSAGLLIYYLDDKNYVSLIMSDNSLALIELVNGVEKQLVPEFVNKYLVNGRQKITIKVVDQKATIYVNNKRIFNSIAINESHGYAGITMWDDNKQSIAKLYSLSIQPAI